MTKDKLRLQEKYIYLLLGLLLIGVRFFHFGPDIDDPHSWRQCDTAHYIYDFYENGVDLLHPKVCWMGGYGVTALEFPLPEAIVAEAYHIFGESHIVARIVFFIFFLLSVFYLYKIIHHLFDERLAYLTAIIYMGLPLALFYSRAIHVDFCALMFGFAGAYFFLKGLDDFKWTTWLSSSILFSLSFLIKMPTIFAFGFPLILLALQKKEQLLPNLKFIPFLLLPVVSFVLWRNHANQINGAVPDWSFIRHFHPMTNMSGWYFGTWDQRMNVEIWGKMLNRSSLELAGISGLILMVGGWIVNKKRMLFVAVWGLGIVLYYLIFYNLNIRHNYYQIPFIPFIALSIAFFLNFSFKKWGIIALTFLLLLVLGENIYRSEWTTYPHSREYYFVNNFFIDAGKFIQEKTEKDDLLILAGPNQDPRSPFLMYRARRTGWPMNIGNLTLDIIQKLQTDGATQLVLIFPKDPPRELETFISTHTIEKSTAKRPYGAVWNIWVVGLA